MIILSFLRLCARHGRLVLVLGLIAGMALPGVAQAMKPWLPHMLAVLLFIAALRIGPEQAMGTLSDLKTILAIVGIYQIVVPLIVVFILLALDISGPLATALILMTAASSISAGSNITLLTGNDPAPALRLLVVGTAALPLTVMPVFWLTPAIGSTSAVIMISLRLLVIIVLATLAAFTVRRLWLRAPKKETIEAIDGLSAFSLAVIVIGLMSALGPALKTDLTSVFVTLAAVFAANFGFQILAWLVLRSAGVTRERVAFSVAAGNRNMALFLVALPAEITDPMLLFLACYQFPMYLTPLLLARLYKPASSEQ